MDDNKALEMRLEDEPFLNSKPNFGQNLISLHNRGIYTLNDFITMDLKSIPNTETRNTFFRMIDILKCKYLGEDLVCDVLLKGHLNSIEEDFKKDCSKLGIPFIRRVYRGLFRSNIDKSNLTMKDYLNDYDVRNSHSKYLVDFYLEYIKIKEDKKDDTITSPELEALKKQLSSLTSQRDDLDKQIMDVQNQIQIMSEGKNNARK